MYVYIYIVYVLLCIVIDKDIVEMCIYNIYIFIYI